MTMLAAEPLPRIWQEQAALAAGSDALCVMLEYAAADGGYRLIPCFVLTSQAQLCLIPEPTIVFDDGDEGRARHGYNAEAWLVAHRATGVALSAAIPNYGIARALARLLEPAGNWELFTRGPAPRAPHNALPPFQWRWIQTLCREAKMRSSQ